MYSGSFFSMRLIFQSTPPARGATSRQGCSHIFDIFQSTPPARGATIIYNHPQQSRNISIHAPREGGDQRHRRCKAQFCHFNPRPPRGGRRRGRSPAHQYGDFNPRPPRGGRHYGYFDKLRYSAISIHAPREGGDSKDAQFYLRIFDKQVELLRFLGKIRGGCLRNPEKDRRFLGKSLANLPEISGHLDFAGGGKARPGYPCAVPLPRRAACVRGSGDPPADRCSSYRNAPLFSHIASPDSKSADCLSQNP